jgi:hypothetical protein
MGPKPKPLAERFWPKVERRGPEECWPWKSAFASHGYGVIGTGAHSTETAHRVSWILANGDIPGGLWVLHTCDNRACVNPSHLYLGTVKENARDLWARGKPVANIRANVTPEVEKKRVASLPRGAAHWRNRANA